MLKHKKKKYPNDCWISLTACATGYCLHLLQENALAELLKTRLTENSSAQETGAGLKYFPMEPQVATPDTQWQPMTSAAVA